MGEIKYLNLKIIKSLLLESTSGGHLDKQVCIANGLKYSCIDNA